MLLGGAGIGAALMYMLDPEKGNRRRALVRDKAIGLKNDAAEMVTSKSRDLRNRAQGVIAETKSALTSNEQESRDQANAMMTPNR